MTIDEMKMKKEVEKIAYGVVSRFLGSTGFVKDKITDNPTESLSLVNRKYVTMNGTARPTSSVTGQLFLDTSLASGRGKPIWWNGTGWIDATGTYV